MAPSDEPDGLYNAIFDIDLDRLRARAMSFVYCLNCRHLKSRRLQPHTGQILVHERHDRLPDEHLALIIGMHPIAAKKILITAAVEESGAHVHDAAVVFHRQL